MLTSRAVLIALLILIQLGFWTALLLWLTNYSALISMIFVLISVTVACYIINREKNPAFTLGWVTLILLAPLFGGLMYLLFGSPRPKRKMRRQLKEGNQITDPYRLDHHELVGKIQQEDPVFGGLAAYLADHGYPVYENTQTEYFALGDDAFPVILDELKKARHYIFLEYFIIQEGVMWDSILEILKEKVSEGVEVRLMYDDVGSLFTLHANFAQKMEELGIRCLRFNPFIPFISVVMNNRDHRKILVIDGHTAFTGGFNLADEYINVYPRFGHWKDSGVVVRGEAVWSLTLMFLNMWNSFCPTDTDLEKFRPQVWSEESRTYSEEESAGYVIPYGDSPMDDETLAENVYINMINSATRYIYICTPYLITDQEMTVALCLAAKKGVDVRIMVPGIPDKKTVYQLTQAHFPKLLDNGVKIYRYDPGFVHAKNVVIDDKVATVGTINFDYRSLYLHFECGTLNYKNKVVEQIRDDFLDTLNRCSPVVIKGSNRLHVVREIYYAILRLIAPLF